MKLLVTGAASFVGQELVKQCDRLGYEHVGIDIAAAAQDPRTVDIRDPDLAASIPEGLDAVIHLAAISRDPDCRRDPVACYDVNVAGTVNVFQAAHARGARQFIFASSEWVYDSFDPVLAKSEDDPIDCSRLTSDYALSKLAAESALRIRHLQTGMPVTVLRFGIIYGPRPAQWSAVETLLAAVAGGGPVTVGSKATARCFIHVGDIARGILAAIGRPGHDIINLQAEAPISLGQIIGGSADLLGLRPEIIETDPAHPSIRNVSGEKAKFLLGWRPRIGLSAGLESIADYLDMRK